MFGFRRNKLFGQKGKLPSEDVDYDNIHSIEIDVDTAEVTDFDGNQENLYDIINVELSTLKGPFDAERPNEINLEYDPVDKTFRVYFNKPTKVTLSKSRRGTSIKVTA